MSASWTAIETALATLLNDAPLVTEAVTVKLADAVGRVLAEDVVAAVSVPPFDNSAMDGYAVRAGDLAAGASVRVTQRISAGSVGVEVVAGEAARIFTGAAMPAGADAVLMQEKAVVSDKCLSTTSVIPVGNNIRRAGQDLIAGEVVLPAGHRLRPQDLGVLASVGVELLQIRRPLKVALLSTGDELREPGQVLLPGQIYNSNRYTLSALLGRLDVEVVDLGICRDTAEDTERLLRKAAGACDLIISSGGVSVGEEDHVKAEVEKLGALKLWKLAIKPGKPLAYGKVLGVPFLGLPGNPAAVFVTFCLVARPYILTMQGCRETAPLSVFLPANFTVAKPGRRQEYLRAKIERDGGTAVVSQFSNQSSGVLSSTSWANCLAIVPIGQAIAEGDMVEVLPLDGLLC
ncbi:molybdopterin molybdochelatase [Sinobacterium caligoides]|uniref:Molybdopterin molybdenumtransferase n=1 Tax=Sinobacterium caligoides TaxID=933926 RepID=A0A3N2D4W5_9GAMM|nr:gephyrin-like molybdotransferase Glp [Sinobacterium caligoides]ROR94845.1 molybdopterin molybdochelatase [Sinobacterium caligoides]